MNLKYTNDGCCSWSINIRLAIKLLSICRESDRFDCELNVEPMNYKSKQALSSKLIKNNFLKN